MNEAKMMWVETPGHAEPQLLSDFVPIDEWVMLYGTHQSRFHVFCPPDSCDVIGNAALKVFENEFGLTFLPNARKQAS
jgi:hypothetical protein